MGYGNFGLSDVGGVYSPPSVQTVEGSEGSSKGSMMGMIAQGVSTVAGAVLAPYTGGASMAIGSAVGQAAKSGLSTLDEPATAGGTKSTPAEAAPIQPLTSVGAANPYGTSGISGPDVMGAVSQPSTGSSTRNLAGMSDSMLNLAKATGAFDKIKDLLTTSSNNVSGFGSGIDWSSAMNKDWSSFASGLSNDVSNYSPYLESAASSSGASSEALNNLFSGEMSSTEIADFLSQMFSSY